MPGKLQLTLAAGDYEIVRPLADGTVEADGIEIIPVLGMGSRERHWRMARRNEFDVSEINICAYFMERDRSAELAAIPVFLQRAPWSTATRGSRVCFPTTKRSRSTTSATPGASRSCT